MTTACQEFCSDVKASHEQWGERHSPVLTPSRCGMGGGEREREINSQDRWNPSL